MIKNDSKYQQSTLTIYTLYTFFLNNIFVIILIKFVSIKIACQQRPQI